MSTVLLDPAFLGDAPLPKPVEVEKGAEDQWPRLLKFDEDTKQRLVQFLDHEITTCFAERQEIVADWTQWQQDYWAKPESKEKNFPFRRAANIVIPLTAIAVEAVYARLLNTLFSIEPFYTIRPRLKEWIEVAPTLEEWFQSEMEGPLGIYSFCRESLLEIIKLGTGVGKSGYKKIVKKSVVTIDGREIDNYVSVYDGATLDHVPLANFLIRLHEKDAQSAIWVGEEHTFNWSEVKGMCKSGRWDRNVVDEMKHFWTTKYGSPSAAGSYEQGKDQNAHTEPLWHEIFRVQEIWLSFDVDGDGNDEEIVVDFHQDSHTILSARYNWYDDLHRPYRIGVYIPVEGRVYGIGIGKQNEQFQKLITTIHRQRLDSQTLANMFQLALKKSSGYGPGEPLFPGKMWFLDDPKNDIVPLIMSDPTITQFNHEDYARTYSEKRTGVNEVVLGMPQEGTPGTATSDMARLAEGNKKFDLVLKNVRRWLGPLGTDVLANYQQFGDNQRHWVKMGAEKGQIIEQVLTMPPQLVRDGAIVEVTVTDSITNKEMQRQQWMGLFAILSQYYDRQKQNAMQLGSPELLFIVSAACLRAEDYLVKRLVETFREANVDVESLLLEPKIIELLNAQAQQLTGGDPTGSGGADQASSMAQLLIAGGNGGQQSRERGATRQRPTNGMGSDKQTGGTQIRT